jgi:hypothetical protein
LAHFRKGALEVGGALPDRLALAVLGAKPPSSWGRIREKLQSNPWFDPAAEIDGTSLRVTTQAGAFKGFGGLFSKPPVVQAASDHFVVKSGDEFWLLTADAFGSTFHRSTADEFRNAKENTTPANLKIKGARVSYKGESFEFTELGDFTSYSANASTLAITSRFTHSVILAALPRTN